ncbi:MAG: phosphoribosylamine--glycine ligase [Verrucomicrobia bacterium]|nr:phosphoribosylamine--glycine ligase [Verrucomicrobiota bacterium]
MKILLLGAGGREHALAWKLSQSRRVSRLWVAPGNAGTEGERLAASGAPVENVAVGAEDIPALLDWAGRFRPDLVVVGPDNPLALGVVDRFRDAGFRIWGPTREAARFESSKAFSQEFMRRHGIPTARAATFDDPEAALRFCATLDGQCAVKADGLALGKGVLLTGSLAEARRAVEDILVRQVFGAAGARVVIQERLIGREISLHALTDGRCCRLFPTAQDHKRIRDGDQGPNTGGMGTYSPAPFLTEPELAAVGRAILDPWIAGCGEEGLDFRGLIYPGVILTTDGPRVIEFNARFGDPETQVYLTRMENDLLDLLEACVDRTLDRHTLRWSPQSSVCVVAASAGYPESSTKGRVIHGLDRVAARPDTKVFHAGTARQGDRVVTHGGRVLGVTAWGGTLASARDRAYAALADVEFEGMQYRRDIAAQALGIRD